MTISFVDGGSPMPGGRTSAKKITIAERRQKAVSLRKAGASYPAIAAKLAQEYGAKYSRQHAFQDVDNVLWECREQTAHDAEAVRALELERLDSYLLALAPKIQQGDARAIQTALQVSDRRCKLEGIDPPIQIQVQRGIESGVESELHQFLSTLQERLDGAVYRQVLEAIQQAEPIPSD